MYHLFYFIRCITQFKICLFSYSHTWLQDIFFGLFSPTCVPNTFITFFPFSTCSTQLIPEWHTTPGDMEAWHKCIPCVYHGYASCICVSVRAVSVRTLWNHSLGLRMSVGVADKEKYIMGHTENCSIDFCVCWFNQLIVFKRWIYLFLFLNIVSYTFEMFFFLW